MGYRSDVAIALLKEIYALVPNGLFNEDDYSEVIDCEKHVVIRYYDVKWSYLYDDVKPIMDFIKSLPDDQYAFIRVGEEPGDIEQSGDPDKFNMYTVTTTEILF